MHVRPWENVDVPAHIVRNSSSPTLCLLYPPKYTNKKKITRVVSKGRRDRSKFRNRQTAMPSGSRKRVVELRRRLVVLVPRGECRKGSLRSVSGLVLS